MIVSINHSYINSEKLGDIVPEKERVLYKVLHSAQINNLFG